MKDNTHPIDCRGCPAEYDPCLNHATGDKQAHIIVVGPSPSGFSLGKKQAFYGRYGRLFLKLLEMVKQYGGDKYVGVKVFYTYAARVGAYTPTAKHLDKCQTWLMRDIRSVKGFDGRTPVLVPLGPIAAKAVGLRFGRIVDVVGNEFSVPIKVSSDETRKYTAIPLLSMAHLETKPGTVNVVLSGLLKAVAHGFGERDRKKALDELTKNYIYPKTIEEVRSLVDHVIGYYREEDDTGPDQWAISLDTETNTLKPFSHPDPKVLMLSVSWDNQKAATILLDHPEVPYDPKEAWKHVDRLLRCSKPKCFHNWKFDRKFLETVYGYQVNRVIWDTLLGEHYIDEDKKGHYGLKQLTPIYCPEYEGYDDELHKILRGHEEAADTSNEEEDTPADIEVLTLSDEEIIDRDKASGCPTDRIGEAWSALTSLIDERTQIKKISKKERTEAQQSRFTSLKKDIDNMRAQLHIMRPKKTSKKKGKGKSKKDKGFSQIPLETILEYAAVDADVTRIILRAQAMRLQRSKDWQDAQRVMKYLYLPGARTLSDMEFRGFQIDGDYQNELITEIQTKIVEIKGTIAKKFSPLLNLNAPHQVSEFMSKLNFESIPGEEPGSTGKEILSKYMEIYPPEDPRHLFVAKLLEYRENSKVLTTYLRPYTKLAKDDGKIHCSFHENGTATGRLSSSHPNLQNVPYIAARRVTRDADGNDVVVHPGYNIKKLFVPSKPGYVIVNCDIKGAELRVYTAYSEDQLMIDALNKGMDVHSLITSKVYNLDYDTVNALKETDPDIKEKRTRCKRIVFATFYGGGAYTIAQQINSTVEEAEQLKNFLFNEFPALRNYVQGVESEVRRHQLVSTFFGRRRRFKLAHVNDRNMSDAIREAVNFKIQSTSADLVLSQLCEMDDNFADIGAEMLITVHDSMTFQMPEENLGKLHDFLDHWIVQRVADKYDWLPVPFLYDVEVGPSYGETKPFERDSEEKIGKEETATA